MTFCLFLSFFFLAVSWAVSIEEESKSSSLPSCDPTSPSQKPVSNLNSKSMTCSELFELIYLTRLNVIGELKTQQAGLSLETSLIDMNAIVTKASALFESNMHMTAGILTGRHECVSEQLKFILLAALRKSKNIMAERWKFSWSAIAGDLQKEGFLSEASRFSSRLIEVTENDTKALGAFLISWKNPSDTEYQYFSHEADGRVSTLEALRRDTFKEGEIDAGLIKGFLRHLALPDDDVADFGAGTGRFSSAINETGYVSMHAFDGTPDIDIISKGVVSYANFGIPGLFLGRKFSWVLSIQVLEHVVPEIVDNMLKSLDRHSTKGVVLTWTSPISEVAKCLNPKSQSEVIKTIETQTQLRFDESLTGLLRQEASSDYRNSVFVFLKINN